MTEELKRLLACLGKLDPEKQRIVLLAYYSGWSREQLAHEARHPGEHDQDMVAPQPARNSRVYGTADAGELGESCPNSSTDFKRSRG